MKICPSCSLPNPDDATTCPRCAMSLDGVEKVIKDWKPNVEGDPIRDMARSLNMIAICAGIVTSIITFFFILWLLSSAGVVLFHPRL